VDIISELIADAGVSNFCVDAGGDMLYRNAENEPLRVGLENPEETSEAIGVASLLNASLCGSAGNRRSWAGFNHILDPRSLESPRHLKAVWVVAETALLADALTTALYFVPAEKLRQSFSFEYAIVDAEGGLSASKEFPAEFFYQ
jgi:thiamine biosynthesis lipoprotein